MAGCAGVLPAGYSEARNPSSVSLKQRCNLRTTSALCFRLSLASGVHEFSAALLVDETVFDDIPWRRVTSDVGEHTSTTSKTEPIPGLGTYLPHETSRVATYQILAPIQQRPNTRAKGERMDVKGKKSHDVYTYVKEKIETHETARLSLSSPTYGCVTIYDMYQLNRVTGLRIATQYEPLPLRR